jgi:cation-transporting ATPase 13A1
MVIKAKVRQLGIDPNKYSVLTTHEDWIKLYQIKLKEKAIFEHKKKMALADQKSKKNDLFAEKQQKLAKRVAELEAQGVQFAQWKAMKEFMAEEKEAAKKTKAEMAKLGGVEGQAANLTAQLEDLELDEIPMVKLGDASIAAPFTSKMPSIRSCVDIIRQGRCTLVTSLQMVCLFQLFIVSLLYILPLVSHMRVAPPSILLVPNTCVKLHDQFLLAVGTLFRRGQVRRRPNDCHGYAHDRVIHNRI